MEKIPVSPTRSFNGNQKYEQWLDHAGRSNYAEQVCIFRSESM
jgi:hypothetical protein